MNIRFINNEIREYKQGPFHVANTGEAFEVPDATLADELLHAKARITVGGEMVNVFELATGEKPSVDSDEENELTAGYPDEFPGVDALVAAGLSYEETLLLDKDQLVAIKGIGAKTADAILEAESDR